MRMWMVDPKIMCKNHLLGEHVELHMIVGSLNKKKKMDGYANNNLLEINSIKDRHNKLVEEMISRNIRHNSILKDFDSSYLTNNIVNTKVDSIKSKNDLLHRCIKCKKI